MSERFQPVRVFHRGPAEVAHIRDTRAGRDLYVTRLNGRPVHWDRLDAPVLIPEPRAVAAKILATTRGESRRGSVIGRDEQLTRLAEEGLTRDQIASAGCKTDEALVRIEHFIHLREKGLTNKEIEEREGLGVNVVATALSRAYRYGLEVPPPPYWSRGKVAT